MSWRRPVIPHFSSSSPNFRAYARIAASTASICFRKESLSVHSRSSSQDSSRFILLLRCYSLPPSDRSQQTPSSTSSIVRTREDDTLGPLGQLDCPQENRVEH